MLSSQFLANKTGASRDGTRICSAAMIFQGAVRTGKEQVAMRSFVLGFA